MKTIKRVLEENQEFKTLIKNVLKNIDRDNITDVIKKGADVGYGNFKRYADTVKFALKNRKYIIKMLCRLSEDVGMNIIDFTKSFRLWDDDMLEDFIKYVGGGKVGGGKPEDTQMLNLMAWFALEEVCRMFEE